MSNTLTTLSLIARRLRASGSVFAEDEARLLLSAAGTREDLAFMIDQRVAGLPVEHVIGWAEFCGLRIAIESRVFVPRRRTEFLVQQVVSVAGPADIVVDLCAGSGAVAAAIAASTEVGEVYAVDIDPGSTRGAGLASPGRTSAGGDQRTPGTRNRRHLRSQRPRSIRGDVGRS